jgi:hypothetical protein
MSNFGLTPQQAQFITSKKGQKALSKAAKTQAREKKDKARWKEGKNLAKGFGNITSDINKAIHKIREKINDVYYGKAPINKESKQINPLDYGLINVLNLLLEVDICAIFTYAFNKLPGTPTFDPKKKEEQSKTTLGKIKWEAQNAAYEIQKYIDDFYANYLDPNNPESKLALFITIQNLNNKLNVIKELLADPVLVEAFPSVSAMDNLFNNVQSFFDKYTNIDNIPNEELQKILKFIEDTRTTCVAIQSLNNPGAALQFIDTKFGTGLLKQIEKLNKVVNPKKLTQTIKQINNVSKQIQDVTNKVLSYVNFARVIISIAMLIITILKIINKLLIALAVPNLFTILGLSTKMSEANEKIIDTADYFMKRLQEVNSVLNSIYNLCQDVSLKIQRLLEALRQLVENIIACDNSDSPPLIDAVRDLNMTIANLQAIKDQLDEFVATYDKNKQKKNTSFGEYTIVILNEELTDEGIPRKRRYGVALDVNQAIIVQSTPTFASDDQIIIQEVKLLLISKNLVKSPAISTNAGDLVIMEEAASYLPDSDVDLDSIDNITFDQGLDDPENEDEDDEENDSINLNAFVSGLKGGRKLRRRMRKKMAEQKIKLANDLAAADKGGKFASKMVKKQRIAAIQSAIKAEEELILILKADIKKLIAAAVIVSPTILLLINTKKQKIKGAQEKIKDFQNQLKSVSSR